MSGKSIHISVKREFELNAPFEICADAGNDWTHFAHLHRKSHAEFRLLYKSERREIFFYKARVVFPLPFYNHYLVFREYVPEQDSYRHIYLDLKSGRMNFLDGVNLRKGDGYMAIGNFTFSLPSYWRFFPGLFFRIFKRRMRAVMEEDNRWIAERIRLGGMDRSSCAPEVPASYDLYDDVMSRGFPAADFTFVDHVFEDLRARAR